MLQPRWVTALCAGLIIAAVFFFQFQQQAYRTDFATHPDEAAHFVTGVCVLDYLTSAFGSNPVAFVENYYVRYPKVGLGHWPPLFYAVQAVWYAITGASPLNAILLIGAALAAAGVILFLRLTRIYGFWIALCATAVFLWLPIVRKGAMQVMPDMMAALFGLLAVLAFCDACMRRSPLWIGFALWMLAAILTKESALSLIWFAAAASFLIPGKALEGRKQKMRFAVATCIAVAIALAVYAATGVIRLRGLPSPGGGSFSLQPQVELVKSFFGAASILVYLIATFGGYVALRTWRRRIESDRAVLITAALIWLATLLLSQSAARNVIEDRYLLPVFFPMTILFAEGLQELSQRVIKKRAAWIAAAVAALAIASAPAATLYRRVGYAPVAASIPYDSLGPVILVSSDPSGDGALIAGRLLGDPARAGVVLRATKFLVDSDWMGWDVRLRATTADDVLRRLDAVPVHYVVLDSEGFVSASLRSTHPLLEQAILQRPDHFRLAADFPLYFNGRRRDHAVQVYENLAARGRRPDRIRVDMERTLRRTLDFPVQPRNRPIGAPIAFWSARLASWLDRVPLRVEAPTSLHIEPESDQVGDKGGPGRVYVTAPEGYVWYAANAPGWIRIVHGVGTGDGVVEYSVDKNRSNQFRSAVIVIGTEKFAITQQRAIHTSAR